METVDFRGRTDPVIVRESLRDAGYSEEDIEPRMDELKRLYFRQLKTNLKEGKARLLPGVASLLPLISTETSVITGILTGNFQGSAAIKLQRFNLLPYFRFGVWADDSAVREEMPHIARRILKRDFNMEMPFNRIVIVGDTIHDIHCARSAGAISVAVGTGWENREALLAMEPDYFFDDLSDVKRVIEVLTGCSAAAR